MSKPKTETETRSLSTIAADVRKHWRDTEGKPRVNFGALPYLDAMDSLSSIDDVYGMDSAKSIVAYFLSNATSFRGEDARRIKAELKAMLKA